MVNFFFNFNTSGYFAYYIPIYAILGRIHAGSGSNNRVVENDESLRRYLERVADFRKRVFDDHEEVIFRKGDGSKIYSKKF